MTSAIARIADILLGLCMFKKSNRTDTAPKDEPAIARNQSIFPFAAVLRIDRFSIILAKLVDTIKEQIEKLLAKYGGV